MYRPEYRYVVECHGRGDDTNYPVIRRTAEGNGGLEVANYPYEDLAESVAAFLSRTEERCKIRLANPEVVGTTGLIFKEADV